jgi:hypothetical protein
MYSKENKEETNLKRKNDNNNNRSETVAMTLITIHTTKVIKLVILFAVGITADYQRSFCSKTYSQCKLLTPSPQNPHCPRKVRVAG